MTGGLRSTFYEDYRVGDVVRHSRGRTLSAFDVAGLALLAVNTSDGHFNDHLMREAGAGQAVAFGCVTLAIAAGLVMQDTGEHALEELELHDVRFLAPVVAGDTLYAMSHVADKEDGMVTFDHRCVNERGEVVLTMRRRARIASRGA